MLVSKWHNVCSLYLDVCNRPKRYVESNAFGCVCLTLSSSLMRNCKFQFAICDCVMRRGNAAACEGHWRDFSTPCSLCPCKHYSALLPVAKVRGLLMFRSSRKVGSWNEVAEGYTALVFVWPPPLNLGCCTRDASETLPLGYLWHIWLELSWTYDLAFKISTISTNDLK